MAIYEDLVSKARLKVFLDEIKKHFPVSVNGVKPDSRGNVNIANMTGASTSAAGKAGLAPAPSAGKQNMPLCGDATYKVLPITGGGTGQTTAAGIRNALGLGNTTKAVPVANGGTGSTTVAEAVKALLGSSAIGSSTKPLYYDGAALKACADSIGGGGIVAQLLKENGYAKFANGLILQWGYGTWENTQRLITITLPISFTNTKYFSTKNVPMLAAGHGTEDHEICTFNQTTTTFQFYHQHNAKIGDIYQWFAIGL